MIVGLFLRNFRSYRATNFVPVSWGPKLGIYIGPNGVGKSSIFDALDRYFNGGEWSINAQARRDGGLNSEDKYPFVCPVFLVDRALLSGDISAQASTLSAELWSTQSSVPEMHKFIEWREKLSVHRETHFLLALGKTHADPGRIFLGPFERDKQLRKAFSLTSSRENFTKALGGLQKFILERYSYFYIPVETDPLSYTRLERQQIQKLLDEDIQKEIREAITQSTVVQINKKLDGFLGDIHNSLETYKYKAGYRDSLTLKEVTARVFESYFSKKMLHQKKGNAEIPVSDLSAGEKRKALIDVAYSFLKRRKKRKVEIILAVDEPDASLHVSACHDQFMRLAEMVDLVEPSAQILLTTHWYGFLPIAQAGVAHSMTGVGSDLSFTSIDLYSYREQVKHEVKASKGMLPADVTIKSYNDLVQSVVASVIRSDPFNWIFCEGTSDKIYLESYLSGLVQKKKLRILPVGGFKEVRRVYEYLLPPISDKEYKKHGKIMCLVDTDAQLPKIELGVKDKALVFKRLVYAQGDVRLVPVDDECSAPVTAIEDSLGSSDFYRLIRSFINFKYPGGHALATILSDYQEEKDSRVSYSCMDLRHSARSAIQEFFNESDHKCEFARYYVQNRSNESVAWISEVEGFFS